MDAGTGFVDLAGFTALTEAHGDTEAADLIERFVAMAETAAAEGDQIVKSIGDAVLLQSPSGHRTLEFATRLMRRCAAEPGFPLARGGVHSGPVVVRGGDVFGSTVNVAARIAGQAHGGQLLLSEAVRAECPAEDDLDVIDLGEFDLRNVTGSVHLYEVRIGLDHGCAGIDPVCRMQVERDRAAGRLRHDGRDYWLCSLTCAERFASDPDAFTS